VTLLGKGRSGTRAAARRAGELGKLSEYLAFVLAGEAYAVPISFVVEILKPLPITKVPRTSEDIVGVMSVRGRLVTVCDLRRVLHLKHQKEDHKTRIFLVDAGEGELVGFIVDEVLQVYRLAESEIESASALGGEQQAHIGGVGRPASGPLLVLLDLAPILGKQ
jgi:chemotaxis signal transduction protein